MKNGKKLTLAQRKYLESLGLQSSNWLIVKKETDFWTLIHRYASQTKRILAP